MFRITKNLLTSLALLSTITAVPAQAQEIMANIDVISLPAPLTTGGQPFMNVLSERKSVREYSDKELDAQTLSDLLWATAGVNRPAEGKLTSPTALNCQEIDLYLFTKEDVQLYDAKTNTLKQVAAGDHRALVAAQQDYVLQAPVAVVFVANLDKLILPNGVALPEAAAHQMACLDAGIACQNLNLFCANAGLATVPRASMDAAAISKLLNLTTSQLPLINNPVGYPK